MGIEHEFGYKNNPNSQAYIESHHSVIEMEFGVSLLMDDAYFWDSTILLHSFINFG